MFKRWQIILLVAVGLLVGIWVTGSFVSGGRAARLSQNAKEALAQGRWDEAYQYYTEMTQEATTMDLMAEGYLGMGDVQFEKKNFPEAKSAYEKVIQEFPDSDAARLAQEKLGKVNIATLFSPNLTPMYQKVAVKPGDTLGRLAKTHGTTVDLLMKANQLKNTVIRPGMKLKVPVSRFSILVDKSQNLLTLKAGEEVFKVYPVATGENNSTPVGKFKIINKLVDPVWYTLGAIVPPESPENVLGSRWMGFDEPGYGIHGTRDPASIGRQMTKGCVRMHNEDVEELYAIIPIGTEVTVID